MIVFFSILIILIKISNLKIIPGPKTPNFKEDWQMDDKDVIKRSNLGFLKPQEF